MQGGDTMAMINAIWPFILMGGIFYFMLYRCLLYTSDAADEL